MRSHSRILLFLFFSEILSDLPLSAKQQENSQQQTVPETRAREEEEEEEEETYSNKLLHKHALFMYKCDYNVCHSLPSLSFFY